MAARPVKESVVTPLDPIDEAGSAEPIEALEATERSELSSPSWTSYIGDIDSLLSPHAPRFPKIDLPQQQMTAIVAGGSLAGLAAALQLAHRGFQVTVWEARQDPGSPAGQAKISSALDGLRKAHELRDRDPARAAALFKESRAGLRELAHGRQRAIGLDQGVLTALRSHGVDVDLLEPLRTANLFLPAIAGKVTLKEVQSSPTVSDPRIDPMELLVGRMPTVVTAFSELEDTALRQAALRHPNIRIEYGRAVNNWSWDADGVTAQSKGGDTIRAAIGVAADGGRAATGALGVRRREANFPVRERLGVVVFEAPATRGPSDGTVRMSADGTWRSGCTTVAGFWSLTGKLRPGESAQTLEQEAREMGITGALIDKDDWENRLEIVDRTVIGDRIFIVGDAVRRGAPLLGVLAQSVFLDAQNVADTVSGRTATGALHPAAREWFEARTRAYTEALLEIEELFANVPGQSAVMTRLAAHGDTLLKHLDALDVSLHISDGQQRVLRLHVELDLGSVGREIEVSLPGLASIFRRLGRVTIDGQAILRLIPRGIELVHDAEHEFKISTGSETLIVQDGALSLSERDGEWTLCLDGLTVERGRPDKRYTVAFDAVSTMPESLVRGLVGRLSPQSGGTAGRQSAAGVIKSFDGSVRVRVGRFTLGEVQLVVHRPTHSSVQVQVADRGGKATLERVSLRFNEGNIKITNGDDLMMRYMPASAKALVATGMLLNPIGTTLALGMARGVARHVASQTEHVSELVYAPHQGLQIKYGYAWLQLPILPNLASEIDRNFDPAGLLRQLLEILSRISLSLAWS
jgi:2-polyprenyl-6-methoxyphenol hydroxylase-like FAD-dependent oxidoreductase